MIFNQVIAVICGLALFVLGVIFGKEILGRKTEGVIRVAEDDEGVVNICMSFDSFEDGEELDPDTLVEMLKSKDQITFSVEYLRGKNL